MKICLQTAEVYGTISIIVYGKLTVLSLLHTQRIRRLFTALQERMAQRVASWGTKLVSKTTSGTLGRLCKDSSGAYDTV